MLRYLSRARGGPFAGWMGIVMLTLVMLLLIGCGPQTPQLLLAQMSTPVMATPTSPSPNSIRTLTGPELDATKMAFLQEPEGDRQTRVAQATAFALGTPYPFTPIALPPQPTTIPPPLGINGGCAQGNKRFRYGRPGCWVGFVDGEYVFVTAGARTSDLSQGLIFVYTSTANLQTYGPAEWYSTPSRGGVVTPEQVTWPILTLVADDGTKFYFDLAVRQWVSPAVTVPTTILIPSPTNLPSVYDRQALRATIVALVPVLPTITVDPAVPRDRAESEQRSEQWARAQHTAIALYPPPNPLPNEWFPTPAPPLTPWPETEHRAAGAGTIWEEHWNPQCFRMINTANFWEQVVAGQRLVAWAGSPFEPRDPEQGAVLIALFDAGTGEVLQEPELYRTSDRFGKVAVEDAVGVVLQLRSTSGALFYFDLASREWVSAPPPAPPGPSPSVSPSAAPQPTPVP